MNGVFCGEYVFFFIDNNIVKYVVMLFDWYDCRFNWFDGCVDFVL